MANPKDKDNDTEFPGYPHYPSGEDIMNSKNDERVEMDVEDISRSPGYTNVPGEAVDPVPSADEDAFLSDVSDNAYNATEANDADITPDDMIALGEPDANFVTTKKPAENDLDIPGTEDDDADEEIGEEDEENNYYSLGGDAHENLEEDPGV